MWKPIWEKIPRFSSSGMRNVFSTLQSLTCRLLLKIFLSKSISFCLMVSGCIPYLLLLIHTQPRSTLLFTICALSCRLLLLLAICVHSCKIHDSIALSSYQTHLWVFYSANEWITELTKQTLIQSGFLLFIISTRPRRVNWVQLNYYRLNNYKISLLH